jgi:CBS domain containing-hemolysin-like protein
MTAATLLASPLGLGVQVVVFLVLVAVSGLWAACEASMSTAPSFYRRRLGRPGEDDAQALGPPASAFTAVLVGKHLANVAAGGLAVAIAFSLLAVPWWQAALLGVAVGGLLVLVAGEIAPRVSASHDPEAEGPDMTSAIRLAQALTAPVVASIERVADASGTGRPAPQRVLLDEEEVQRVVEAGRDQGVLADEKTEMIASVIEFGADQVGEVMAPRTDVVAIEAGSPIEEIAGLVTDTGFSRIPVYREDLDNIVGLVYAKDLLDALQEDPKQPADSVMKETLFVPETTPLDEALREMRIRRIHMAIVHDEFGGTAGLVTMEDLLEEIVGDIFDEYDPEAETIERVGEREAILDARMDIERVNDELGLSLPSQRGYETLGGFLFHRLGRPGRAGETVGHQGKTFTLEEVANRRILKVRVELPEDETVDEDE